MPTCTPDALPPPMAPPQPALTLLISSDPVPEERVKRHAEQLAPVHRPANEHQTWVDVAKGVCILLVVLYHVVEKQFLPSFQLPSVARDAWTAVVMGLVPLRMPLFFLVSGFLAARSLTRSWRTTAGPRVLSPYYLYVVWLLIHLVWFTVGPDIADEGRALDSVPDFLFNLVLASTSLWYLYALATYFVLAKALRASRWPVLGAAALLNVAVAAQWLPVTGQTTALLQNLVYFLLGIYMPDMVRRWASIPWRRTTAISTAVVLFGLLVLKRALDADGVPGLLLVLSLLACVAGASASAWASAVSLRGTDVLARLGRRTLAIYVFHLPLLAVLQALIPGASPVPLPGGVPAALAYPVVVTALVAAASLTAGSLLARIRLGVLLSPPWRGSRGKVNTLRATPPERP